MTGVAAPFLFCYQCSCVCCSDFCCQRRFVTWLQSINRGYRHKSRYQVSNGQLAPEIGGLPCCYFHSRSSLCLINTTACSPRLIEPVSPQFFSFFSCSPSTSIFTCCELFLLSYSNLPSVFRTCKSLRLCFGGRNSLEKPFLTV